jgi:hypothetical protein
MTPYASWTGSRKTLQELRAHNWRLLMSPETLKRTAGKTAPKWADGSPAPYALDNGAWTAHQQNQPFDVAAFKWAYGRIGAGADWVVIPDFVGNAIETLRMLRIWYCKIQHPRKLIAVQDGMEPADVLPYLKRGGGLFIGGSTDWKLQTLPKWGALAASLKCWLHVGRVNTVRRIRHCQQAGADSFDGTSATRFSKNIPRLTRSLNQLNLWGDYDPGLI